MAKKKKQETKDSPEDEQFKAIEARLPPEAREKLRELRAKLKTFQGKVLEKFDQYIMAISILPKMPKPAPGAMPQGQAMQAMPPAGSAPQPNVPPQAATQPPSDDDVGVLILVDDSDSQKMAKQDLKGKLEAIILEIAKQVDEHLKPQVILLSEVWGSCFDAKYDLLALIASSGPFYDTGMLSALKIAEIHKTMVLRKFEKYIVSYVFAGSLVKGEATKSSDIDVFVVIDDTDVKKMTRTELKDKLRAIIIGMGMEAGEMTGIRNKLNIQVYILTEFWDGIREANPVMFTFLRDGIPFYDRGIFMPWKQLLRMGKIKPSPEAIDMFMSTGNQMLNRVKATLNTLAMEDIYYAILTPSQAALMMKDIPPPSPRETPILMQDIFVKKEKMLEEKWVKILRDQIKVRKDIEHGTKKATSGKEIDQMVTDATNYLERVGKLFSQIEEQREKESVARSYDHLASMVRDALHSEGIDHVPDDAIVQLFEEAFVHKGKMQPKQARALRDVQKAVADYESGKLTKPDLEKAKKQAAQLEKGVVEYLQRKRAGELERAKIKVRHGDRYGEVLLLGETAFIIHDLAAKDQISKASVKDDTLGEPKTATLDELEQALATAKIPPRTFIKESMFEQLKKIFG
ncbi:hypothetical protein COV94_04380, partial [Candidatus Woesearchaeota archaeon CG11_big_fil_rev_8_21_14_0_20_57_5]